MEQEALAALTEEVDLLMSNEAWQAAIERCTQVPELVSTSHELLWNVGWAHFQLGLFKLAVHNLQSALRLKPGSRSSLWALGVAYRELGQYETAEHYLKACLALRDGYLPRLGLALTYMKQGKLEQARAVHLEGLRLKPHCPERLAAYEDFLSDIGDTEEIRQIQKKLFVLSS